MRRHGKIDVMNMHDSSIENTGADMEEATEEVDKIKITPEQIERKVKRILKKTPTKSWDQAIKNIVGKNNDLVDES